MSREFILLCVIAIGYLLMLIENALNSINDTLRTIIKNKEDASKAMQEKE